MPQTAMNSVGGTSMGRAWGTIHSAKLSAKKKASSSSQATSESLERIPPARTALYGGLSRPFLCCYF